jgi:prepilin-type N-terminal cleavage/methylation domain-containing protein
MPSRKSPSAFTLIELMIVIAIIGLLATLAAVGLSSARAKSRDTKRAADFKQLQKALDVAYNPSLGYPLASGGTPVTIGLAATKVICAKTVTGVTSIIFAADASACDANVIYMPLVPANPSTVAAADYKYESYKGGAACASAPCDGYCISTVLEQGLPTNNLAAGSLIVDQATLKNGTCP